MPDIPRLFDPQLRAQRKLRMLDGPSPPSFLHQAMLETIEDRIAFIARRFSRAVVFGDIPPTAWPRFAEGQEKVSLTMDEQLPVTAQGADLIVCAGALHAVNDVPGLLTQMRLALQPDGLMVASFLGGDTLHELRDCLLHAEADVTGAAALRIHPMIGVAEGGGLLQRAGFAMPVADIDRLSVSYAHPLDLLRDLRALGETSVLVDRPRPFLRRDVLSRMCDLYLQRYSTSAGRVIASFSLITLSGWSPAENQPQPKRRGSATQSLATAIPAARTRRPQPGG